MYTEIGNTLKWLAVGLLLWIGCSIKEHISFDINYSGIRTIEFQYHDNGEYLFNTDDNNKAHWPEVLDLIEEAFLYTDNASALTIDTTHCDIAKIQYRFENGGLTVREPSQFLSVLHRMPDQLKWYFDHQPNQLKVLDHNSVQWDKFPQSLTRENKEGALEGIEVQTILEFAKPIKSISDPSINIANDRKTIEAIINTDDLIKIKSPREVVIVFEE